MEPIFSETDDTTDSNRVEIHVVLQFYNVVSANLDLSIIISITGVYLSSFRLCFAVQMLFSKYKNDVHT